MNAPKLGKKEEVKKVAKKLTELRDKPISKKVFEIVDENSKRLNGNKKVAKPSDDLDI